MYEVTIKRSFSAAHALKDISSICEKLHGHNFLVEVSVYSGYSGLLNNTGILIDFNILKTWTEELLKELDHKYLNEVDYFKNISPSAENIAKFIYDRIMEKAQCHNLDVSRVTVWESEDSRASYGLTSILSRE